MAIFVSGKSIVLKAIKEGDVSLLRAILKEQPEWLEKKFHVGFIGMFDGFILDMAAYYNQPKVIEFLVTEKKVDINRQNGVSCQWSALHLACRNDSYEAAEMLVKLGANVGAKASHDTTPLALCSSGPCKERLRELFRQARQEKETAPERTDIWRRISPDEIVHDRDLPESGYHITDIFNFEARYWTSITRDLKSGVPAQTQQFFDEMPDTRLLHLAHEKYKELGGTIGADVIDSQPLRGRNKTL
ncbi:MAG: ankyrin repeat domain-containing protein [Proteobacteria bacterium]|nr:ankyrin repeat domain-containing protein [Pseudomonadota bacterium]